MDKAALKEIEYKPTADLIPYARNARTHSEAQVNQIAASIKEFGFNNPVLIGEDNGIIAGHGRVLAAQKLGLERVPCLRLGHLSETERRAYVLADNKIALNAGWDEAMLALEVKDLAELGDPDAVPTLLATTVSQAQDVWICGDHRIMCGSSSDLNDVVFLCGSGQTIDLILTDPPYGVSFERGKFHGKSPKGTFKPIENDGLKGEGLTDFIAQVFSNAFAVSKDAPVYAWSAPLLEGAALSQGLIRAGMRIQSQIVWRKNSLVLGRADYQWQHEICWYGFKEGSPHAWYGGRDKTTVWDCNKISKMELHPTTKPVELFEIAITNSSKGGDFVLDLFGGSGTTMIACERLGRKGVLMEIEPTYVDVTVRRWQKFTGREAVLSNGPDAGKTFDQVAALRGSERGSLEVELKKGKKSK